MGDLDGDGDLDIAASVITDNSVRLLLNRGDATFRLARIGFTATPYELASGDFNGDGKSDLVVTGEGEAQLLFGSQDERLPDARVLAGTKGYRPPRVLDLNGDGRLDLILAFTDTTTVNNMRVLLGKGDGTFAAPRDYSGDFGQIVWPDAKGGRPGLMVTGQRGLTLLRDLSY
jgi:hypothetical protein